MNIKTFHTIEDLKSFFGFNLSGTILETDLWKIENETDVNGRKFHDAEVLTTISRNLQGDSLMVMELTK